MKNADMPVAPTTVKVKRNVPIGNRYPAYSEIECYGLTKREMFAIHAMSIAMQAHSYERAAQEAVKYADALLSELEK